MGLFTNKTGRRDFLKGLIKMLPALFVKTTANKPKGSTAFDLDVKITFREWNG